jgi:hypothetical protein
MKLKIYFEDIEIGLPIDVTEKKISENMIDLKETFKLIVDNAHLLDTIKYTDNDGR